MYFKLNLARTARSASVRSVISPSSPYLEKVSATPENIRVARGISRTSTPAELSETAPSPPQTRRSIPAERPHRSASPVAAGVRRDPQTQEKSERVSLCKRKTRCSPPELRWIRRRTRSWSMGRDLPCLAQDGDRAVYSSRQVGMAQIVFPPLGLGSDKAFTV